MQAIETKYHGPTENRDRRISATCQAGRIITNYKSELNLEQNHIAAAVQLCVKLGWSYDFVSGTLKNKHFVHVFIEITRGDIIPRIESPRVLNLH